MTPVGNGPLPWLLLAVGNPSRGDDALGPRLLQRLRDAGVEGAGDVELLTDFQLQVEHALDLQGRRGVLFVDAALPGAASGSVLTAIGAEGPLPPASHALRPQAVLQVALRIGMPPPPAWLLAIEGSGFELGAALSTTAEIHLVLAEGLAMDWLTARRRALREADQPLTCTS